jgi:hypothetical protein
LTDVSEKFTSAVSRLLGAASHKAAVFIILTVRTSFLSKEFLDYLSDCWHLMRNLLHEPVYVESVNMATLRHNLHVIFAL